MLKLEKVVGCIVTLLTLLSKKIIIIGFDYMKIKLIMMLFILFMCIGSVYGGNNTTDVLNPKMLEDNDLNTTIALESGDSNISFSNNMTGYCVEYTEQEAKKGDVFYVADTSHIKNNQTNKDASQYIKRYFIEYYNETQKDTIVTQHMIWHFTDDFHGWRLNYTIINNIKNSNNNYGDDGTVRWNSTHDMKYSFRALLSPYEHHQNYFIYDILFIPINKTENNTDIQNYTSNNTATNKSDDLNATDMQNIENKLKERTINNNHTQIMKPMELMQTGNSFILLIISLFMVFICRRK